MKNYYQTLEVPRFATTEEIKVAFRKLAHEFHPDKNNGDVYFEEKFKEIKEAYDVLSSNNLRILYNKKYDILFSTNYQHESKVKYTTNYQTNKTENNLKKDVLFTNFYKNITIKKIGIFCITLLLFWRFFKNFIPSLLWTTLSFIVISWFLSNYNPKKYSNIFDKIGNTLIISVIIFLFSTPIYINLFSANNNKILSDSIKTADKIIEADSVAIMVDPDYIVATDTASENVVINSQHKGNKLNNGDSPLINCFGNGEYVGKANITFINSNSTDAIVCLVDYKNEKTIRNEYIRAGSSFNMSRIPTGIYYLKVYYGNDWNPNLINFCGYKGGFDSDVHFSKSDSYDDLIQIHNTSRSFTRGTITLYAVANGNMGSKNINEKEFFK